jgi:hypothetical protein
MVGGKREREPLVHIRKNIDRKLEQDRLILRIILKIGSNRRNYATGPKGFSK